MPFMVIYSTSDGGRCYEQADAIDEAALFVERLRNKDGIDDQIRIYRMEEISFAFRPYYKVELGMPERQGGGPSPAVASEPPATVVAVDPADPDPGAATTEGPSDADAPASVHADADGLGLNGRRGLFGR